MPRLYHTKAKTGCRRCKARKVKCDEGKPKCGACTKHDVPCTYTAGNASPALASPRLSPATRTNKGTNYGDATPATNSQLELRLLHLWSAHTSQTFSPAVDFWRFQAPSVALDCPYALAALLALTALHASWKAPTEWIRLDNRKFPVKNPIYGSAHPERLRTGLWKELPDDWKTSRALTCFTNPSSPANNQAVLDTLENPEMQSISHAYFNKAVEGHRQALAATLSESNIEQLFMTSVLISFYALFTLNERHGSMAPSILNATRWLQLAKGTRFIGRQWFAIAGPAWRVQSGLFYGEPDLTDSYDLFNPEHSKPFEELLTWSPPGQQGATENHAVCQQVLSYICRIRKGIISGTDAPLTTSRRCMAMPSRCPPEFVSLVEAKQPRALVVLAHFFAVLKLIENAIPWYAGIAECQIPAVLGNLPECWKRLMKWPLMIIGHEMPVDELDRSFPNVRSMVLNAFDSEEIF